MIPILAFGMPAAPEWIFIGILALVLFGPKRIPEIARGIGKALGELQRAKEDFHREISGVPPLPKIESPAGREISGKPISDKLENATPEATGAPVAPEIPEDHNKAS